LLEQGAGLRFLSYEMPSIMVKAFLRIEEGFVASEDEFFASWKIRLDAPEKRIHH
jgi:hypothetical protein